MGFLWFGTQTGLYKYNGYRVERYDFRSDPANRFAANFITAIVEDDSQNLWVGTFGGGLFKLNPKTGEYLNYRQDPQNPDSLHDNTIRALWQDDSGRLRIGTQNGGLDCLDPSQEYFTHFEKINDDPNCIRSNTITSLCQDQFGTLWIGTIGGGLNKFDLHSGKFVYDEEQTDSPGRMKDENISSLYLDQTGVLWVVTADGGLSSLYAASGVLLDSGFPELTDLRVSAVCEDSSGHLWIGTYGHGVRMLNKDSGELTTRGSDFSTMASSLKHRVLSLYADTSGNLWIGTEASGIDKINTNLNFSSYSKMSSGLDFSDDVILSVYKDRSGIIWLGTANGGINRFDRENSRVSWYQNNPKGNSSLSSNAVSAIFEDSRGTFWFGTIDGTLNKLDLASGKFVRYRIRNVENANLPDNGILRIYEDSSGMLWVCAANGGLVRFDRSTGEYTQFIHNPQDSHGLSSNHVLSLADDGSGRLWVGTAGGGLNRLDPTTGEFTFYSLNEPDSDTPTRDYSVNAIVNDNEILWLATDRGLYQLDKASGESVFVKDNQQNANTVIYGLLPDGLGNLWLSTADGLIRYNQQYNTFHQYDFQAGLERNRYNAGAYYQSDDGELFFGGTNGFNCFYPDRIKNNRHEFPVVVTDFKIFNTSTQLPVAGKISLTYKDNFISFEFAALDYANPLRNQYAYKLEGFDQDWHYSGTRNYASYTNLDSGEYVLKVKAANNDGFWSERGVQIGLSIAPPFWRTTWFRTMALVLILGLIVAVIKLRTRSIRLKSVELERQVTERTRELNQANEQLRRVDEMKNDFLSMVSHEIRTPLNAILGFTELIAAKIEKTLLPHMDLTDKKVQKTAEKIGRDLQIILAEGDRLAALVDNLLNISRIESGKTDWQSGRVDISALIDQALAITRPVMEKAGLTVQVDIEAGLPEISGDKNMLIQVLLNLLANAVKFTREGNVKVSARNSEGGVLVAVSDTGPGIAPDQLERVFEQFYQGKPQAAGGSENKGIGLGLYICKQIVEKHNGRIWAESQLGQGSTFYFHLPAE